MYAKTTDGTWLCLVPRLVLMPVAHAEDGGQQLVAVAVSEDNASPTGSALPAAPTGTGPSPSSAPSAATPNPKPSPDWLRCSAAPSWATRRERVVRAVVPPGTRTTTVALVLEQPSPHWERFGIRGLTCYAAQQGLDEHAATEPLPRELGELPIEGATLSLPHVAVPTDLAAQAALQRAVAHLGHMAAAAAWLAAPPPE